MRRRFWVGGAVAGALLLLGLLVLSASGDEQKTTDGVVFVVAEPWHVNTWLCNNPAGCVITPEGSPERSVPYFGTSGSGYVTTECLASETVGANDCGHTNKDLANKVGEPSIWRFGGGSGW